MAIEAAENLKPIPPDAGRILAGMRSEPDESFSPVTHQGFLHFWVLVGESFMRNRCLVRASALAYTTLLALVPLMAVVVSVTTSILKKDSEKPSLEMIEKFVGSVLPPVSVSAGAKAGTDLRGEVVTYISSFVENTQSGTLGTTGMIGLVFVAIMLLSNIEATFNDIWGVERGRGWLARVIQYWAAITLGPLILVLVIGLTTSPHFQSTQAWISHLPWIGEFLFAAIFSLLPFFLLTGAFTLFYQLMPNTRVQFRAALIGGVVGGFLWQLNNVLNVTYVSNAVTYGKMYGKFGILPLFLVGLYFSWVILLFGAQVAYAFQNRQAYLQEKISESVNQRGREFLALRIMTFLAQRFHFGLSAPTSLQIGTTLGVPTGLVRQIMRVMVKARLVVEAGALEMAYVPSRPLDRINCHDVLEALRAAQGHTLETTEDGSRELVRKTFSDIHQAEMETARDISFETLAIQAGEPSSPRPKGASGEK